MLECSDLKQEITRLQNQGGNGAMLEGEIKDDDIVIAQSGSQEQQKPTKQGNFVLHVCLGFSFRVGPSNSIVQY